MGMCLPCFGGAADDVVVTPDPETRRRQLAEAAEKRQKEKSHLQTCKSHARVKLRQHTGVSKIQKQLRGKGKNRKKLRNRR
ncbi:small VCP/p97-interacting protein-like isoform X2 [Parambassis ranga]|uniref:Small VCP/p97-interacting protein isoform X2 n=1 Tax=Parambassis ranga TaxID=210632 RepID=A0A6P7K8Q9_9TELE|nr:small VCP/p97-interacting protein-like isoform X2 [Parambassis ranga]XP_028285882.1 small VCP/p97-interacting protein isoform X2 [Parambassis ranga]